MKRAPFFLFLLALGLSESAFALRWAPRERAFPKLVADPREIRMVISRRSGNRFDATVGNYFSFFAFGEAEGPVNTEWRGAFGLEGAGFFTLRQEDARFPLESVDGLFGLYLEAARDQLRLQLRFTHISAHLADGLPTAGSFVSTREFFQTRAAWRAFPGFDVYGGLQFLANAKPLRPRFGVQAGAMALLPWGTDFVKPFSAVDAKWRGETRRDPSVTAQLGAAFGTTGEDLRGTLRLFYAYYRGADPRGQFWDDRLETHSANLEMDL